jgi:hypothetical protein
MRLIWRIYCVVSIGSLALIADVDAIVYYGKMSGGISYVAAKEKDPDSEAHKKVLEADAFARKFGKINPNAFKNIPGEMSADELAYELLNWPDNSQAASQIKVDAELQSRIMNINEYSIGNDRDIIKDIRDVDFKIALAQKMLSKAKIIDQRIIKKAVSEVLRQLSELDNEAKKLLDKLRDDVIAGSISEKIGNYAIQIQAIYEKSPIDFGAILSQKYEEDPNSVRLMEQNSKTHAAVKNSIDSKQALLNALLDYIKSLSGKSPQLTAIETQTDLTGEEIDRQHEEIGTLNVSNREIAKLREEIAKLRAENTELFNQLDAAPSRVKCNGGKIWN